jgi:hypothetical protein
MEKDLEVQPAAHIVAWMAYRRACLDAQAVLNAALETAWQNYDAEIAASKDTRDSFWAIVHYYKACDIAREAYRIACAIAANEYAPERIRYEYEMRCRDDI